MTGAEALARVIPALRAAGVVGPERDARTLLAHAIGVDRSRLMLHLQELLSKDTEMAFLRMIADREARHPVSHIVGGRLFHDRWFHVTPDVLDPRPETETLVQLALERPFASLLDLGTGSGAIAVTLLAERPETTGAATDLSAVALEVASQNARRHGVADRLQLAQSDWYDAITSRFDLIVSNPPYIAVDEMPALAPEVRDHEPRIALTDEADGLTAYRAIAAGAKEHLAPGGRLLVEIGPMQGSAVSEIFSAAGLDAIVVHPDLDGRDRVVSASRRRDAVT
ncbi:peptide chain release factor N(5)-glutamine methyltransferase [Pseudoruegeria sp. HB172150]|uniref:peptide chain release factor N(5)-glutamine methyltransferase n=1 Tax=Pseudoruegeria sp. HB172150 TaxID=2721164 RepID=UPI001551A428|nr:peptide chain release factor N(5)-glutamine methyltransferase [Pseudoruegeria sp. HB172150]